METGFSPRRHEDTKSGRISDAAEPPRPCGVFQSALRTGRLCCLALTATLAQPALAFQEQETQKVELLRTDSRAPYVHRITLYDEDGEAISPEDEPTRPYSPARTCGKCHPYEQIRGGWHFNAGRPDVDRGRPGEPWLWVDEFTGTQVPISLRGWPGTCKPQDLGLTKWQFFKRFGRHMPGGAIVGVEGGRWRVSGVPEIDCLLCHNADATHNPAERARQLERENYRWSHTAALGVAVVRGEARKAPDDWDPLMPPDPDFPERSGPIVVYDSSRFDPDERVLFNISRAPPAGRCYFCHTVREVAASSPQRWQTDADVHLTAGMTCTDCHRNGLDHAITRGDENDPSAAALSCRGCHLGEPDATPGRLGAPVPLHAGLPTLHLERLTCTACHSGPIPAAAQREFQTSLAHGLGLGSKQREDHASPHIRGPVFVRQADGRIGPQRVVWPAFWGRMDSNALKAVALDEVQRAVKTALPQRARTTSGTFSSAQIAAILEALTSENQPPPVFVSAGRIRRRAADGSLTIAEHAAAAPYAWPIGHDVRPARRSLGAAGCTDCHARAAPFYFGTTAAQAIARGQSPAAELMFELRGDDAALVHAWASSFALRPTFKGVGFACTAILGAVLLIYGFTGLAALLRRIA